MPKSARLRCRRRAPRTRLWGMAPELADALHLRELWRSLLGLWTDELDEGLSLSDGAFYFVVEGVTVQIEEIEEIEVAEDIEDVEEIEAIEDIEGTWFP